MVSRVSSLCTKKGYLPVAWPQGSRSSRPPQLQQRAQMSTASERRSISFQDNRLEQGDRVRRSAEFQPWAKGQGGRAVRTEVGQVEPKKETDRVRQSYRREETDSGSVAVSKGKQRWDAPQMMVSWMVAADRYVQASLPSTGASCLAPTGASDCRSGEGEAVRGGSCSV